jgi:hypothetical protein
VKAQAQLYFLTNAATARLALYEGQLALSLTDGGGDTLIKIVGDPIAYLQDYRCNVSSDPASGTTDAVNLFFGGTADDVKQGFQALISAGPNTILGRTAMGQTEQVQTLSRPAFPTTRNDRSSVISRLATNPRGRPSRPSSGANAWKSRPNGGAEGRLPGARSTSSSTTARRPTVDPLMHSSGRHPTRRLSTCGQQSASLASRRSSPRFGGEEGRCWSRDRRPQHGSVPSQDLEAHAARFVAEVELDHGGRPVEPTGIRADHLDHRLGLVVGRGQPAPVGNLVAIGPKRLGLPIPV